MSGQTTDAISGAALKLLAEFVHQLDEQYAGHEIAVEKAMIAMPTHCAEVWFDDTLGGHLLRILPPGADRMGSDETGRHR